MVALSGLVEVDASKPTDRTVRQKGRDPAAYVRPLLLGASAVAVLLLADAGLLLGL